MHFWPRQDLDEEKAWIETGSPTKQVCFANSKQQLTTDKYYATTAPLRLPYYESANLEKIISNITHLMTDQKAKFLMTLKTHQQFWRVSWRLERRCSSTLTQSWCKAILCLTLLNLAQSTECYQTWGILPVWHWSYAAIKGQGSWSEQMGIQSFWSS